MTPLPTIGLWKENRTISLYNIVCFSQKKVLLRIHLILFGQIEHGVGYQNMIFQRGSGRQGQGSEINTINTICLPRNSLLCTFLMLQLVLTLDSTTHMYIIQKNTKASDRTIVKIWSQWSTSQRDNQQYSGLFSGLCQFEWFSL